MIMHKIYRVFLAILVIAVLLGCSKSASSLDVTKAGQVDQALVLSNPALAMIERFKMGSNLEVMAVQVAKKTVTYTMVEKKFGATEAPSVVSQEIKKLLPVYQERWNQNLAKAYALHLSPEELRSLAETGNQSPHVKKLLSVQTVVGSEMQKISSTLLTDFVTEALMGAME
jgi:hypothetical protein